MWFKSIHRKLNSKIHVRVWEIVTLAEAGIVDLGAVTHRHIQVMYEIRGFIFFKE